MEIATNAVLAAVLLQASQFSKDLGLPLQTPLQESNVVAFRTYAIWSQADSDLNGYLAYRGGHEFRFSHGIINNFNSRESFLSLQDPRGMAAYIGPVRYSEAECLAKARLVIGNLGYSNITLLQVPPKVRGPTKLKAGVVPRFVFAWPRAEEPQFDDVEIEVNATTLGIEKIALTNPAFWRKGWPVTFGTTNTVQDFIGRPIPAGPERAELEVLDVSREYAMAYIHAILPEVSAFCAKLGAPLPEQISMEDIVMGKSQVAIKRGRLSATLRLKSGHLVIFHAGHVWAVHAPDAVYTSPWDREEIRQSSEYLRPVRFTRREVIEKTRHLLVSQLGLDEKALWLGTEPVCTPESDIKSDHGIRRYLVQWQAPETPEEKQDRMRRYMMARMSVSAEIDAVSGDIKTLNFFHPSLERPDPELNVPMRVQEPGKEKTTAAPNAK